MEPKYVITMGLSHFHVQGEAEAEKKELDLLSLRTAIKKRHLAIKRYSLTMWDAKILDKPLKIK